MRFFLGFLVMLSVFKTEAQSELTLSNEKHGSETKILKTKNYSISYPSDWTVDQTNQMGTDFIILSQLTSESDLFSENVNLIVQDLTGYDLDLAAYTQLSIDQIKALITDAELISSEKINGAENDFQKVIYTGRQGQYQLKFEQYYLVENNKAYVLTLTCEIDQFDSYQKQGEQILNSFKLMKN